MKYLKYLFFTTSIVILASGCNKKTEPTIPKAQVEINDESCKSENIAKLDREEQKRVSSACLRRGSYKPSTGQTW